MGSLGEREGWPCDGCSLLTPAGYNHESPTPLLITFHGDEGDPDYVRWKLEDTTMQAGFLMLNLQCPRDLGCGSYEGSWWRWEAYGNHDNGWVGRQLDEVEAEYNVDRQRILLAGFSGGSSYLSEYPWPFTMRYAAVVYFGGGYDPHGVNCQVDCKIPAYFLIGSQDFLLDSATDLKDYLVDCGHDVTWKKIPGVDHQIISDKLGEVYTWLAEREHPCRVDPTPEADPDPSPNPDPGPDTPPMTDPMMTPDGDPNSDAPTEPTSCSAPACVACSDCVSECVCRGQTQIACQRTCSPNSPDEAQPASVSWVDRGDDDPTCQTIRSRPTRPLAPIALLALSLLCASRSPRRQGA
jgi:predicted esterase